MSLFKLKNLWSQSFPNQEFDEKHLAIGEIHGNPVLALGSFKGVLRVYMLKAKDQIQVTLIYQSNFDSGIIDIEFVQHPEQSHSTLGVLLFKKFVYLSFAPTEHPNNFKAKNLTIQCEPAFKIEPNAPLSILTLNSSIQYLNPMSILKIKQSDPIFPCSCFKYLDEKVIYYGDGQELVSLKGGTQQWRIILGEMRQIQVLKQQKKSDDTIIVIFGSNNLWEVCESVVSRSKVMDDDVICGSILYKSETENPEQFYNIAVANFQDQIMIYTRNYTLIWAIKCQNTPIKFFVFDSSHFRGALAILSEQGNVEISYGGTQIAQTQLVAINQNVDMEQVQREIARYQEEIEKKKHNKKEVHTEVSDSQQIVRVKARAMIPSSVLEHVETEINLLMRGQGYWCCKIECLVSIQKQSLSNVNVSVVLPSNIFCSNQNQKFPLLKNKQTIYFNLFCSSEKFPFDSTVQVLIKYELNSKKNKLNVLSRKCRLPSDFQSSFISRELIQKSENKIVIEANKELPELRKIFNEFDQINDSKNMTIQLANGVKSSMGYNKTNSKLKIQSNYFPGLCFLFTSFLARMEQLCKPQQYILTIKVLPLEELASVIKQHYEKREALKKAGEELQKKCEEFRAGEKKLLVKLKQKMGSSNQIQVLLEYTYNRLLQAADKYDKVKEELQIINHNLEIALKFTTELAFMKCQATPLCRKKVLGIIGYQEGGCVPMGQYGWEEKIMGNSAYYLNKGFNYLTDKYTFQQIYKIVVWAVSKANSGEWNQ